MRQAPHVTLSLGEVEPRKCPVSSSQDTICEFTIVTETFAAWPDFIHAGRSMLATSAPCPPGSDTWMKPDLVIVDSAAEESITVRVTS